MSWNESSGFNFLKISLIFILSSSGAKGFDIQSENLRTKKVFKDSTSLNSIFLDQLDSGDFYRVSVVPFAIFNTRNLNEDTYLNFQIGLS